MVSEILVNICAGNNLSPEYTKPYTWTIVDLPLKLHI